MKSLLVVAHGSRRKESNEEVRELVAKMDTHTHAYTELKAAFLELAEPLIPDGIRQLIQNGATEVIIQPYFLSAGRHVVKDIPKDVNIVRAEHPDITITIAPYLGEAEEVSALLFKQAALAGK